MSWLTRSLLAASVGASLLVACGGMSESDGTGASGGSGGSSASGGNGGSGGTASGGTGNSGGSGGGGGGACVPSGACAPEGETCSPTDQCCPCQYRCKGGTWQPDVCPSCPAPRCPPVAPKNGDSCSLCEVPDMDCQYGDCVSGPAEIARCEGNRWRVAPIPCPLIRCGPDPSSPGCRPGELCVNPGALGDVPHCEPNPCPANTPVSCTCAGQLCTIGFCTNTTDTQVFCDCPTC